MDLFNIGISPNAASKTSICAIARMLLNKKSHQMPPRSAQLPTCCPRGNRPPRSCRQRSACGPPCGDAYGFAYVEMPTATLIFSNYISSKIHSNYLIKNIAVKNIERIL
jgi:hypothetical protein